MVTPSQAEVVVRMLSSIQSLSHASGNQAPRSTSAPHSADATASEDRTADWDGFASLIAALMPASSAPVPVAVQTEAEAGKPRITDTNQPRLPGPDAAEATLEQANADAPERINRPESNALATGSAASDGLDLTFAAPTATPVPGSSVDSGARNPAPSAPSAFGTRPMDPRRAPSDVSVADSVVPRTATDRLHRDLTGPGTTATSSAGVAAQLMTEAVTDRLAATQVPSLPDDVGEQGLPLIAQVGAVEGSTAFRALPPDPSMRPVAQAPTDDSIARPVAPDSRPSAFAASASVGPSETSQPIQETSTKSEIPAQPDRENRVVRTALTVDTPRSDEPVDTVVTVPGTMFTDPPPGSALSASPGLATMTAPQEGTPGGSLPTLREIPAEIVRQNMQHIAEATRRLDLGTIEITLSPEELGHVRLTVNSHDITGATVVLQADRPETLDLMRRHVDLLAQDMREFGYRELTFAFQDRRPSDREAPAFGRDTDDSAGRNAAPGKVSAGTVTGASRPSIQDGRLDIRI